MCNDSSICAKFDPSSEKKLANIWYLIGLAWQCGDGLDENEKMAIDSFRRAARYGNPEAMRCLADYCVYRDRDLMAAIGWWILAFRIDLNSSTPETERGEAETVRRYREAAERGCAGAQARLGECCFFGNGTDQNKKEAVKWFRMAAAKSNPTAMFRLGCLYPGFPRTHNEDSPWRFDSHGLVDLPLFLQNLADDRPASRFAEALYGIQFHQHLLKRVLLV